MKFSKKKLTIRRLILKSNAFIVMASLVTLFLVFLLVISAFGRQIRREIDNDLTIDYNVFTVQNLIKEHDNTDWNSLSKSISVHNYYLLVKSNSDVVYKSDFETDKEKLGNIMSKDLEGEFGLYNDDPLTVIKKQILINDETYTIAAVKIFEEDFNTRHYEILYLIIYSVTIVGTITIIAIMIVSRIFTNVMVSKIMKPLNKLIDGVGRIEKNNYAEEIVYEGELEFAMLCDSFNNMQRHLLIEMEKNNHIDQARTEMIAGISHDLRTPLTSIKGFLKGMKDGVANTDEKKEKYINISYRKACEMENLLQKLFYYSKLESKVMPFSFEVTDLNKILGQIVSEIQDEFEEGISLDYKNPDIVMDTSVDIDQFSRVIHNLIDNCVKYSGIRPLEIIVTIEEKAHDYKIIVSDNGLGVPEEKLDKLFNQFYRGDESRGGSIDGSGLGLYVSKQIVQRHGGSISAYNDKGFSVMITLAKDEKENMYGKSINR